MYEQAERLYYLLNCLNDALNNQKKVNAGQSIRLDKDIVLNDNAKLTINQIQYVIIDQSEKWISEAMQITNDLLKSLPNHNLPLPEATRQFKQNCLLKAIEDEGGLKHGSRVSAAKRLGITYRQLKYYIKGN